MDFHPDHRLISKIQDQTSPKQTTPMQKPRPEPYPSRKPAGISRCPEDHPVTRYANQTPIETNRSIRPAASRRSRQHRPPRPNLKTNPTLPHLRHYSGRRRQRGCRGRYDGPGSGRPFMRRAFMESNSIGLNRNQSERIRRVGNRVDPEQKGHSEQADQASRAMQSDPGRRSRPRPAQG